MKELLRTKGFRLTPQRELIFRCFVDLAKHVSVDELYARVRQKDSSIGYSTVWRTMKLICRIGLAEEVNIGDGITRYDRVTGEPHGHLYCLGCKRFIEFGVRKVTGMLLKLAAEHDFAVDGVKVEIQGYCQACREKLKKERSQKTAPDALALAGQNGGGSSRSNRVRSGGNTRRH